MKKTTDKLPSGIIEEGITAIKTYGFMGTLARYLLLISETGNFINIPDKRYSSSLKKSLVKKFNHIHKNIPCAHSPYQMILVAKHIFSLNIDGPIIECGSYKGGSSAKLSLIAEITGRKLIICDSFTGLPAPEINEGYLKSHGYHPDVVFKEGQYMGTLEEVKKNIETYGSMNVCEFVPGLFEDTLKNLTIKPACVFLDVDLISSARSCLKYLWPGTLKGGIWFTHEACFPDYVKEILSPHWWKDELKEYPPIIWGGGSGLSELAKALGYFVK